MLIPGVLLLLGVGILYPDSPKLEPLLLPDNLGEAAVHVIVAYAAGHLLQVFGNLFEWAYWKAWRGRPTDWPFSRRLKVGEFSKKQIDLVSKLAGMTSVANLEDWQQAVATVRTAATEKGITSRLQVFNGNYGMFRGMVAAGLVILVISAVQRNYIAFLTVFAVIVLATIRMDRFARHYGREFFSCARVLKKMREKDGT